MEHKEDAALFHALKVNDDTNDYVYNYLMVLFDIPWSHSLYGIGFISTCIKQECIKLIKIVSKDFYIVTIKW